MSTLQSFFYLFLLFFLNCIFIFIGMLISKWLRKHHAGDGGEDNKIMEGAILALLGLLIALSFTSAYERFDLRRALVIKEANTIQEAYLRSFLFPPPLQAQEQKTIRNYLSLRIFFYHFFPDRAPSIQDRKVLIGMEKQIWLPAIDYCSKAKDSTICPLFLESANLMFNTAYERIEMAFIHPPTVIFAMLVMLAFLSAMICGYNLRKRIIKHFLHLIIYAFIITVTIYVVIDLEYPRIGFLKVDYFDYILQDQLQKLYEFQRVK